MSGKIPIALQLYSVRDDCAKDFAGVLAALSEMGYDGVEFAGFYDHTPAQVKELVDKNGLKVAGSHTGIEALVGDNLQKTVDLNNEIGNKNLIVPGLPGEYTESIAAWEKTADLFNELVDKLAPHGMRLGYHNHAHEFKPLEGRIPWDVFFSRTRPEVIAQLDIGHVLRAEADPIPYMEKFPGRFQLVHVKEFPDDKFIGDGDVPFEKCFEICETTGKTEWYIIEVEAYPLPPLETVKKDLENMRAMGK